MKLLGIGLGLGGAILCIATQPGDDLASNAMAGNLICLVSSIVYAIYLVVSNRLLKGVGDMTLLKYTFLGAAVMSLIVNSIYGFEAPIMSMSLFSTPMLVLLLFFWMVKIVLDVDLSGVKIKGMLPERKE